MGFLTRNLKAETKPAGRNNAPLAKQASTFHHPHEPTDRSP
jgi:hypothetical protein